MDYRALTVAEITARLARLARPSAALLRRLRRDPRRGVRQLAVRYERDGKLLALATIFRDEESLRTEIAMERDVR